MRTILLLFLIPLLAKSVTLVEIDCIRDCKNPDYTNPNYKPQLCHQKCAQVLENMEKEDPKSGDIHELELKVERLMTMTIALLVLVIPMFFLLLFFILKNSTCSSALLKTLRKKQHHTNVTITADKSAVHIPNYSVQQSSFRTSIQPPHERRPFTSTPNNHIPCQPRTRKASESTCPDESETVDAAAYDNLAISTSTLNAHTRPSSPASQSTSSPVSNPSPSIATLNTTMTTIQMDSGLHPRSDVARRTTP